MKLHCHHGDHICTNNLHFKQNLHGIHHCTHARLMVFSFYTRQSGITRDWIQQQDTNYKSSSSLSQKWRMTKGGAPHVLYRIKSHKTFFPCIYFTIYKYWSWIFLRMLTSCCSPCLRPNYYCIRQVFTDLRTNGIHLLQTLQFHFIHESTRLRK